MAPPRLATKVSFQSVVTFVLTSINLPSQALCHPHCLFHWHLLPKYHQSCGTIYDVQRFFFGSCGNLNTGPKQFDKCRNQPSTNFNKSQCLISKPAISSIESRQDPNCQTDIKTANNSYCAISFLLCNFFLLCNWFFIVQFLSCRFKVGDCQKLCQLKVGEPTQGHLPIDLVQLQQLFARRARQPTIGWQ